MSHTSNVAVAPIGAAPITTSTTTTTTTGYPATTATVGAAPMAPMGTTGYPATTTTGAAGMAPVGSASTHHSSSTDKKLIKEQEKAEKQHEKEVAKEEKEVNKEEKKREKALAKEQKKREKEEKKMLKQREKEEKKQRKLMQKEEEKRIHEQRTLHETAQKARMEKYRAEEKATTARLMSDVREFDLAHAKTAPLGLYSEQVDDALPYVPENVGLFVAVARGRNLIDAKESKADAYVRVLLLGLAPKEAAVAGGVAPPRKEIVHAAHKSEVKSNTANPEWWFHADDTPHLVTENVGWLRTGKLRIEVWDHDKTSSDELLGTIEWSLSALDGKVTRGNFALQPSQLPLATGRTVRKATQPGSIFAEIRYRSPFAFLGMHQQKQGQGMGMQQTGLMQQQQQQQQPLMMGTSSGLPLASSTTTTTTMMSSGPLLASGAPLAAQHQHHSGPGMHHTSGVQHHGAGMHTGALAGTGMHGTHQPVLAAGLPSTTTTASTGGVSTVYRAPDVIVPAGALGSMGAVAPGAISHTHHIHATELPAVASTSTTMTGLPVMGASHTHTTAHTHTQPHLLGGEQKKEYMLSEQHKAGMMTGTHQPLPIVTGTSAMGASLPATPAEPHNITHNKAGSYPSGTAQPVSAGTGATLATALPGYHPASDPGLNPVLTGAKPAEYQATGVQQPMVGASATGAAAVPLVGAINLADPPRHVM